MIRRDVISKCFRHFEKVTSTGILRIRGKSTMFEQVIKQKKATRTSCSPGKKKLNIFQNILVDR